MKTFDELSRDLVRRLDEHDRGDHGWWLITRVHLESTVIVGILQYLSGVATDNRVELTPQHYREIARVAGIRSDQPGIQLKRHHLLALQTPLNLIRRVHGNSWTEIELTTTGRQVATGSQPRYDLEKGLRRVVFCRAPWFTETRIEAYNSFDVGPYDACLSIATCCDGWIHRDEYDLFVSRIRRMSEVEDAIEAILSFRLLSRTEKDELLSEVRDRIPTNKTYQNWRDMALHTFSLLSLGRSFIRDGQYLRLSGTQLIVAPAGETQGEARRIDTRYEVATRDFAELAQGPHDELLAAPSDRATNSGFDAEIIVSDALVSRGWTVVNYSNRRGYGFDLWATRADDTIVIEVKSSVDLVGSIVLTETEYAAAVRYGSNYVLAIVEHMGEDKPTIDLIPDPVSILDFRSRSTNEYVSARFEDVN